MKGVDAAALRDRLARALAWTAMTEGERSSYRAKAAALVNELEDDYTNTQTIGWMLLVVEDDEVETEA